MNFCINIKEEGFKKLLKKTGLPDWKLSAIMGAWMEENSTEEWPKLKDILSFNLTNYQKAISLNPESAANKVRELLVNNRIKVSESTFYFALDKTEQKAWKSYKIKSRGKNPGQTKKGYLLSENVVLKSENNNVFVYIGLDIENDYIVYKLPVDIINDGDEVTYLKIIKDKHFENQKELEKEFLIQRQIDEEFNKRKIKTKNISDKKHLVYKLFNFKDILIKFLTNKINDYAYLGLDKNLINSLKSNIEISNSQKNSLQNIFDAENFRRDFLKEIEDYLNSIDEKVFKESIIENYKNNGIPEESLPNIKKFLDRLPLHSIWLLDFKNDSSFFGGGYYFSLSSEKNKSSVKINNIDFLNKLKFNHRNAIEYQTTNLSFKRFISYHPELGITQEDIDKVNTNLRDDIEKYIREKNLADSDELRKNFRRNTGYRSLLIKQLIHEKIKSSGVWFSKKYDFNLNTAFKKYQSRFDSIDSIMYEKAELLLKTKYSNLFDFINHLNNIFPLLYNNQQQDIDIFSKVNISSKTETIKQFIPSNEELFLVLGHEIGHSVDYHMSILNPELRKSIEDLITDLLPNPIFADYLKTGLTNRGYSLNNIKEIIPDIFTYLIASTDEDLKTNEGMLSGLDKLFKNKDSEPVLKELYNTYLKKYEKQFNINPDIKKTWFKKIVDIIQEWINSVLIKYFGKTKLNKTESSALELYKTFFEKAVLNKDNFDYKLLLDVPNKSSIWNMQPLSNENKSNFSIDDIEKDLLNTNYFFKKYGDIRIKQHFYAEALNYLGENYKGFYKIKKYLPKGNKGRTIYYVKLQNQSEIALQKSSNYSEKANKNLNNIVKRFLSSVNTLIEYDDIVGENARLTVTKAGKELYKLITIAKNEGKIDTLTEEAAHMLVLMTDKDDPQLKILMNNIDKTELYKEIYEEYKDDEYYQDVNGDVDIIKIKKEAVGKLITQSVLNKFSTSENVSYWDKLVELAKRLFKRIVKKFSKLDEVKLKETLDKASETFAEKILNNDVEKLSDENLGIKNTIFSEQVFKQKKDKDKRKYTEEDKETPVEKYIKDLTEQIHRLENQPSRGERDIEIRAELHKLYERLSEFKDAKNSPMKKSVHNLLVEYAVKDISDIENKLSYFNDWTLDEKKRFFNVANQYLEGWKKLNNVVEFEGELQKTINDISGKATNIQLKVYKIYEDYYNTLFNLNKPSPINYFSSQIDDSGFGYKYLNISTSKIPLVRKIFDKLNDANFYAADQTALDHKFIKDETKKLKDWAKKKGMPENELWEIFAQKRANGKKTGNYIHEISQNYYDKKASKRAEVDAAKGTLQYNSLYRKYNKWLDENNERVINKDAWLKEIEAAKFRYSIDGKLDEKSYNKWYNLYNPNGTGLYKNSRAFVKLVPKVELWYDERMNIIKNTPELNHYYNNVLVKTLEEKIKYMPYISGYKMNFLPELAKHSLLNFSDMPGALKNLKSSFFKLFTQPVQGDTVRILPDPTAGGLQKEIPIYMMSGMLEPDEKNYNLEDVLTHFTAVANLYKYRQDIHDDIVILRSLFDKVLENEVTSTGEKLKTNISNRYIKKKINALSNIKKALDYAIDHGLYDIKKSKGDVSKQIAIINEGKSNESAVGFSFSKIGDELIVLTRRKGMGLNVFSSTANMLFGIITNMIESNSRQFFTEKDAQKGLYQMISTVFTSKFSDQSKKVLLLMDKFRVLKDFSDTGMESSGILKDKISKILFYLQEKSELFIHGQTFLALTYNTKIKDLKGNDKTLFDAYKVVNNGLVWDTENYGEERYGELTKEKKDFVNKMNDIIEMLHGDYNPDNAKLYNKVVIDRILMVFRAWMPQAWYARLGSERLDERLGDEVIRKGRWRSYAEYFNQEDKTKMEGIGEMFTSISKELVKQFSNMLMFNLGYIDKDNFSMLEEIDKQNMRRNVAALRYTLIVFSLMLLLKGIDLDDKDEEEQAMVKFLLTQSLRINNDLQFFASPSAQSVILRDIIPLMGTVNDFMDMYPATIKLIKGEDELKAGPNAGRSNFMRQFNQNIPGINQLQKLFELSDSKVSTGRNH